MKKNHYLFFRKTISKNINQKRYSNRRNNPSYRGYYISLSKKIWVIRISSWYSSQTKKMLRKKSQINSNKYTKKNEFLIIIHLFSNQEKREIRKLFQQKLQKLPLLIKHNGNELLHNKCHAKLSQV